MIIVERRTATSLSERAQSHGDGGLCLQWPPEHYKVRATSIAAFFTAALTIARSHCLCARGCRRWGRIAVVTGGNRGIGLEVCRQLAGNDGITTVVLTARDEARGVAAVEKLRALGLSNVVFHQLDITDVPSVTRLADFLKTRFGKLDILVKNAGIVGLEYLQDHIDGTPTTNEEKFVGMGMDQRLDLLLKWCLRATSDAGKVCLRTNYHGTKRVIGALLPLLLASDDGRVVNVSSEFGQLRHFGNAELARELDDVETLTEERLDEVVSTFVADLDSGAAPESRGWPAGAFSAYMVSKAALNAYSRVLARLHPAALRVNCVHPGFVRTDMTVNLGLVSPEEGAGRVAAVALLPAGGPTGAYFQDRRQAPFL
ncbi:hypothetical protein U9M48_010934 [Paspalum notatum var. saurae]|uniref:Uncharacterized protein n=1 Tax=Paspalum notatum var. saurae TaxID=547442 RepID=A0AAQ3SU84_PASNO